MIALSVYLTDAVGRLQSLYPIFKMVKPTMVCGIAAILLYLINQKGPRRIQNLRGRPVTCVWLLLVWSVLSIPFALNPASALFFTTGSFVKTVLLYLLLVGSVRSLKDVERLALVYFGSAVLYASIVLLRFDVSEDNWRLAGLYTYDANDFAVLAITAVPLGLYFLAARSKPLIKYGSFLGILALAAGFIRSGSRGGFLSAIAVGIYVLAGHSTIKVRWRLLGLAAITTIFIATASDRYWTQMSTILSSQGDYNRTANTGRIQIWKRGMGYMLGHPITGVGIANYGVAEGTISPLAELQQFGIGVPWTTAHNSFVQVGAELGIPGLIFFVVLIGSTFTMLWRTARVEGPLAQALTGSLIGFTVGGYFLSLAYTDMCYVLLGLAAALAKVVRLHHGAVATPSPRVMRVRGRRGRGGLPVNA
ncbi:MAG TPA: O-antigen ligase family protein [Gemmatimonadales bacterium]|nr:O-antigen ligase family protein [Gemmatimonadales bacterium]